MISIEAYRSAIGRFYGKAKKTDKPKTFQTSGIAWILFEMVLLLLLYGIFIAFPCIRFFIHFIMFLVLFISYAYCLTFVCIAMDLISLGFEKMAHGSKVFRKPSLPNGIKAHQALVYCRYLDTFVLDGRDWKTGTESMLFESNIAYRNRKMYHTALTIYTYTRKLLSKVINPGCYIVILGLMLFSFKFMHDFIKVNRKGSQYGNVMSHINHTTNYFEQYSLHHLKLLQLLVDGDVESNPGPVNYTETPKGKGRPKKTKKLSNFGKPKVLDFTSIVNDNRFLKQSNLIHLKDIKLWSNMCQPTSTKSQFNPRPELNCKVSLFKEIL